MSLGGLYLGGHFMTFIFRNSRQIKVMEKLKGKRLFVTLNEIGMHLI